MILIFIGISVYYRFKESQKIQVKKEEIRIMVLNGCGEPKLALKTKKFLEFSGFTVVDIGDTFHDFEKTLVVDHLYKDKRNALFVADFLKVPKKNVVFVPDTLLSDVMNVSIILGADYKKYIPDTVKPIQ